MGSWWRADGTSWVKVRNEKRKREGEAKMVAWKDELARRKAAREDAGNMAGKENQHFLERDKYKIYRRLQLQAELDDCIDAVRHDARTVYCEHVRKMGNWACWRRARQKNSSESCSSRSCLPQARVRIATKRLLICDARTGASAQRPCLPCP